MRSSVFSLFTGRDGQYYFTLRARGNSEPILQSEGYTTRAACYNGIESVRRHAPFDSNFVRKGVGAGNLWFVLRAANHEVIGVSETYSSKQARENGIAAVKRDAPVAKVVDQTRI